MFADRPLGAFLEWVELVVDAINGALAGIDPADVPEGRPGRMRGVACSCRRSRLAVVLGREHRWRLLVRERQLAVRSHTK